LVTLPELRCARYLRGGLVAVVVPPAWQAQPARGLAEAPDQPAAAVELLQVVHPRHHRTAVAAVAAVAVVAVVAAVAWATAEPVSPPVV
jgi:hypothetical protein